MKVHTYRIENGHKYIMRMSIHIEFLISIIVTFPAIFRLNLDKLILKWWGKLENQAKPKSLATSSHANLK